MIRAVGGFTVNGPRKIFAVEAVHHGTQSDGPACECIACGGCQEIGKLRERQFVRKMFHDVNGESACVGAGIVGGCAFDAESPELFRMETQGGAFKWRQIVDLPRHVQIFGVGSGDIGCEEIFGAEGNRNLIAGERKRNIRDSGFQHIDSQLLGDASGSRSHCDVDIKFTLFHPSVCECRRVTGFDAVDSPKVSGTFDVEISGRNGEFASNGHIVYSVGVVKDYLRTLSGSDDVFAVA